MACLVGSLGLLAACSDDAEPTGGITATVESVVYRIPSVGLFGVPLDASMPAERISQPLIGGGEVFADFVVDPDGTRVVYKADADTDEVLELYALNVDGTDFQKLNAPLPLGQAVDDFKLPQPPQ